MADDAKNDHLENLANDPLLDLAGLGAQIWSDEHSDEYVRRLREGWK